MVVHLGLSIYTRLKHRHKIFLRRVYLNISLKATESHVSLHCLLVCLAWIFKNQISYDYLCILIFLLPGHLVYVTIGLKLYIKSWWSHVYTAGGNNSFSWVSKLPTVQQSCPDPVKASTIPVRSWFQWPHLAQKLAFHSPSSCLFLLHSFWSLHCNVLQVFKGMIYTPCL